MVGGAKIGCHQQGRGRIKEQLLDPFAQLHPSRVSVFPVCDPYVVGFIYHKHQGPTHHRHLVLGMKYINIKDNKAQKKNRHSQLVTIMIYATISHDILPFEPQHLDYLRQSYQPVCPRGEQHYYRI